MKKKNSLMWLQSFLLIPKDTKINHIKVRGGPSLPRARSQVPMFGVAGGQVLPLVAEFCTSYRVVHPPPR